MPSEPEAPSQVPGDTDEKQLCVSCMFPNEPAAHFCAKCGAPTSSYASTPITTHNRMKTATESAASIKETFMGEGIKPETSSFSTDSMANGKPGLPRSFLWKGQSYPVLEILEEWKEAGNCSHGSGEHYVRKHWFRIRTTANLEMRIYFERQKRSSGGSRWRLYSIRSSEPSDARAANSTC